MQALGKGLLWFFSIVWTASPVVTPRLSGVQHRESMSGKNEYRQPRMHKTRGWFTFDQAKRPKSKVGRLAQAEFEPTTNDCGFKGQNLFGCLSVYSTIVS